MYYDGKGVPCDYAEAAKWWRQAAHNAEQKQLDTLGTHKGDGVPP
jgi:TPR repeat protein